MTGGIRIELSRCPFGAAQQALDRNSHQISGKRVDPTRAVANPIGSSTTGGFVVEKPPPPIEHTGSCQPVKALRNCARFSGISCSLHRFCEAAMTQMTARATSDLAPAPMIAGAIPRIDVAGHLAGTLSPAERQRRNCAG